MCRLCQSSAATHALAAVVAQVAVAVSHGDGSAAVAGGGIRLEAGELLAADLRSIVGTGRGVRREQRQLVGCRGLSVAHEVSVGLRGSVAVRWLPTRGGRSRSEQGGWKLRAHSRGDLRGGGSLR